MKKIVFILPNLNSGGAERVAINFLRQLDFVKYDVFLVIFDQTTDLLGLIPEKVKLNNLRTKSTKNSFYPLLKLLRALKPHVVYTTHSRVASLLMIVKPFTPSFRHLARMQSTPSLEKKHGEYGFITRFLYAAGFKSADVVIAQTKEMKDDSVEIFGILPKKIAVLHNPLDTAHIHARLQGADNPFPTGEISAVAAGRLSKEKGFQLIVEALPDITKKLPNFILHIMGKDQGEKKHLLKLAESLGVLGKIKFHGYVSTPYSFYAHCDLFILSSYWEGYPNAMLENYYLNTPIVATCCVPVVEQLIEDGVNGYLCRVGDVACLAEQVLKSIKLKREMIKNDKYKTTKLDGLIDEI